VSIQNSIRGDNKITILSVLNPKRSWQNYHIVKERALRHADHSVDFASGFAFRCAGKTGKIKKILFIATSYLVPLGGARRDRTADLLRARQALSHLSYGPMWNSSRAKITDASNRAEAQSKFKGHSRIDIPEFRGLFDRHCEAY
jgi:hypothetical protein